MSERLDKATRRREPVRAFLHYVDRLAKAKRRGTNPRKIATRFWGVSWYPRTSQWRVQYYDDSKPRSKKCHVGYFVDEERAALAYNEALIAADLQHLRPMNRVDPATGRPLPKDQD